MSLASRTQDVCDQLTRYGGRVASEDLLAVLERLTDINDDIVHDRAGRLIDEGIDLAIATLQAMKGKHP